MKRILTFKQKLVLTYVVLIVLPMSVLGMGAYLLYSDTMEQKVSDFVQQVAVSTASNLEMYIRELEQFTLMPYYNKEFQDMLTDDNPSSDALHAIEVKEEIEKTFSFWQSQRDSVEKITYFSKPGSGEQRVYSTGFPYDNLKVEEAPWDERVFSASDRILTYLSLHQLANTGYAQRTEPTHVFSLIRKIYYSSTMMETAGYMQFDFTLEDIGRIMNRINREENGSFFLLDQERRVVFASQPIDEGVLEHVVGQPETAPHAPQIVKLNQQNKILVRHPVGKMGWTVVGYVPVSQLVSGIANVRNSMILIGLVCIVLAIMITTTISHRMTRPIYKLIGLIRRVEAEDFQIRYDDPPRNEIGQLIRSFVRMSGRLDETIRHLYQAEIVRKDSELRTLKSQINPHFLFNTLETIKMKAEIDEADATVDMITALGKLVKSSLHAGKDFMTLREEQAYLLNYFYIQRNRYGSRFEMTMDVDEELMDLYIPRMLIQPLVENAFYHGLEMKQGRGRLSVAVSKEEEAVKIVVADDGLGISPERLQQIRSRLDGGTLKPSDGDDNIGLANVSARIELYFGSPYAMQIESKPGEGTEITLLLPAITSESEVERYVSRYHRG